jgi:hypothetical protein
MSATRPAMPIVFPLRKAVFIADSAYLSTNVSHLPLIQVSVPGKSHNRTSDVLGLHFSDYRVNRPSAATVCFDYFLERGFGITSV